MITEDKESVEDLLQAIDLGPTIETDETPEEEEAESISDKEPPEKVPVKAEGSSKLLVMAFDKINSNICSIASGDDPHRYSLSPTDKKELTEALKTYLDTLEYETSPFFALIIVTVTVCFSKYTLAYKDRKVKKLKPSKQQKRYVSKMKVEKSPTEKIKINDERIKINIPQNDREVSEQITLEDKIIQTDFREKESKRGKFKTIKEGRHKGMFEYNVHGVRNKLSELEDKGESNTPTDFFNDIVHEYTQIYDVDLETAQKKVGVIIRRYQKK